MNAWWLLGLMPVAFIGVFLWRQRINRQHNAFETRMDLAADPDHARKLLQDKLNKQHGPQG